MSRQARGTKDACPRPLNKRSKVCSIRAMIGTSRHANHLLAAAAALLCASALGAGAARAFSASSAATCSPGAYPGTGYFTSLSVSGASCATGRRIELAYYRCRTRHGLAGRCSSRVAGFTCSEHRNTIPTEVDARVVCRAQHKKVVHSYQQNL